jgi:glycosyltransferase involved in cell wall biosynthesis
VARILQVCNSVFYLSHFLAPLVRGLVAAGHEVECVCEGPLNESGVLDSDVRIHDSPFPHSASPAEFLLPVQRLRSLLRSNKYDCVNSHNRNSSIVGRVAAWLENVPVNLYTAHGFYFHDGQGRIAREATVGLEALLSLITDYTLSQSTDDVELMTGRGWIRPSRIEVIGNGIDTRRFAPRGPETRAMLEHSLGLRSGRFRVASTGRLVRGKGFTDLLSAFTTFRERRADVELLIIGGNVHHDIEPFHASFLERARALGVSDALTVTGMVERVEDYLATSDVFVLPSYREGMPRALLEAMAMELPVVATEIRGCREIVRHGRDGLLFKPHDVTSLTALLNRLRDDPDEGATMGRSARARVCARFDERDYVARQIAAIGRLVGDAALGARRQVPSTSTEAMP